MALTQSNANPLDAQSLTLRLALVNAALFAFLFGAGAYLFDRLDAWGPVVSGSPWQAIGRGLVRPLAGWSWVCCIFIVCGTSAAIAHKLFAEGSRRDEYASQVSEYVKRWLLCAGIIVAATMLVLAAAAQVWMLPTGAAGLPIVGFWMFLAAVIPVECGATVPKRKEAVIRAAVIPWAFVLLFPMHMGQRIGGTRTLAIVAGAMMVVTMIGFALFLWATELP